MESPFGSTSQRCPSFGDSRNGVSFSTINNGRSGTKQRSRNMRTKTIMCHGVAASAIALALAAMPARLNAQQPSDPAIPIGGTDLGGVVSGPNGPEAGVWVIAETADLPTKL